MQVPSTARIQSLIGGILFGLLSMGHAADVNVPAFVQEPIHSPNRATVSTVVPSLAADVVLLDGGLEQGLRLGMLCTVSRGTRTIGELIIIESKSHRSAGLILQLVEEATIQAGDIARVKTLQNS